MKTLAYFIILAYLTCNYMNCSSQNRAEKINIRKIEFLDYRIDSLVNDIINKTSNVLTANKYTIELELQEKDSNYYMSVIIRPKNIYNMLYHSNEYSMQIQGYYIVQDFDILVTGDFYSQKMSFTDQEKEFYFLNIKKKIPKNYPPPIYDPVVFEYLLQCNGEITRIK